MLCGRKKAKDAGRKSRTRGFDDKTLAVELFNYCKNNYQSWPAYGKLVVPYMMRLPVFADFFVVKPQGPLPPVTLRGTDYTGEVTVFAASLIAGVLHMNDHFNNMVDGKSGYDNFIKGASWTKPAVKPTTDQKQHFFTDLVLQHVWDSAQADDFTGGFSFQEWRDQIHNFCFNEDGEPEWILGPEFFAGKDVAMQFFVALVCWLGKPDERQDIVNAVTKSYPGPADDLRDVFAIADYDPGYWFLPEYDVTLVQFKNYIEYKGLASFEDRINTFCDACVVISGSTQWHEGERHEIFGPMGAPEISYDDDWLKYTNEYGKHVADWLTKNQTIFQNFKFDLGCQQNIQKIDKKRSHRGLEFNGTGVVRDALVEEEGEEEPAVGTCNAMCNLWPFRS